MYSCNMHIIAKVPCYSVNQHYLHIETWGIVLASPLPYDTEEHLYKLDFIGVQRQIGKKSCTICLFWNAEYPLTDSISKHYKNVVSKKVHHFDFVIYIVPSMRCRRDISL